MLTDKKTAIDSQMDKMLEVIMEAAQGNYSVQVELNGDNGPGDALAMGINMMIDDIKAGVEKIEKDRDFTNNVISSIADLIVVMDIEEKIILINEPGCKLLGFTYADELIGKSLKEIFEGDPFDEAADSENKYLVKNIEKYIITKDNRKVPVLFSTSLLKNKAGKMGGVIGIARDISEKKQNEDKTKEYMRHLERVNKELDQFAYVVSHDLKAPLRAIANLSGWIEEDLGSTLSEDIKKNMNTLRGRVHRMEALINGILSYSRSTRSKVEIGKVDVGLLLDDILEGILISEKFSVIKKVQMPEIVNNKIWIEQIFSNLISNAIKHHDKPVGKIEINYTEEAAFHKFSVSDDGPGIPKEFQEKVFTIFQTLEARDKVENTGVGLSIVKKIIEEQQGKIWIESEAGKGTSFIFTLPKEYIKSTIE